jgi:hypothetical protein
MCRHPKRRTPLGRAPGWGSSKHPPYLPETHRRLFGDARGMSSVILRARRPARGWKNAGLSIAGRMSQARHRKSCQIHARYPPSSPGGHLAPPAAQNRRDLVDRRKAQRIGPGVWAVCVKVRERHPTQNRIAARTDRSRSCARPPRPSRWRLPKARRIDSVDV